MLEPEEVLQIALRLYQKKKLTSRQFDCWHAARYEGRTFRDAAVWLRENGQHDISHFTVMMDSRYAHEIVVQACDEVQEGRVRLGHTLQAGSDAWFAVDSTMEAAGRKVRAILVKKKRTGSQNLDFSYK